MTVEELIYELRGYDPSLKIEICVGGESCDNPNLEVRKGNILEIGTT